MTRTAEPRRATILVAADWAPIRAFDPLVRSSPESVYGDLLPVLQRADLRIVNCECALTRRGRAVWKSGSVFKGEPRHVRGLSAVPFDVACLANNHVLDYGVAGLRETLDVLRARGIRTVGAGLTDAVAYSPLTLTVKGTRVHIVNFGEGEDLTDARSGAAGVAGWDIERVSQAVAQCRTQGGVVLAIGHCGLEYIPYPPPYVVATFRALVDAGADCVIGHHPHVPQGIEWYRGRPIAYSLGNFVFYQRTPLHWRKTGFCVTLTVLGGELCGVEMHPYRITEAGLRQLDEPEQLEFGAMLTRISAPLGAPSGIDRAWQAYLAYYGTGGFETEVRGILDRMKDEPRKAAAMFRNRITTMQHREVWRDFLTRTMAGGRTAYSREAYRVIEEWFTKEVSP